KARSCDNFSPRQSPGSLMMASICSDADFSSGEGFVLAFMLRSPLSFVSLFNGVLEQSNEVPVRILCRSDQSAAAYVLDLLHGFRASIKELLEAILDITNVVVRCRARLVSVGIEANVLVAYLEANVIRCISIWLDSQQFLVLRFGFSEIFHRIDYD